MGWLGSCCRRCSCSASRPLRRPPSPRGSLSAYYYSGVRELFVGGLCAIGVFLVIYKLPDFTRESFSSCFAGLAAVVVAVFPTEGRATTLR